MSAGGYSGVTDAAVAEALRETIDAMNSHAKELRSRGYRVDLLLDYPDDQDGSAKIARVDAIEKTVKVQL